jgi:hypothetical protein
MRTQAIEAEAAPAWLAGLLDDRLRSDQPLCAGRFYSNAASFGIEPTQDSFALIELAPKAGPPHLEARVSLLEGRRHAE